MMVIVRPFPNALRSEDIQAEQFKKDIRYRGFLKYRIMAIVMVDHKDPDNKQAHKYRCHDLKPENLYAKYGIQRWYE
jgi:hypothetical protein